jgi:hypothetical protein
LITGLSAEHATVARDLLRCAPLVEVGQVEAGLGITGLAVPQQLLNINA